MKRRLNVWKTPLLGNREQGFCGNRHELPGHCMAGKRKHNSWTLSAPSGGGIYFACRRFRGEDASYYCFTDGEASWNDWMQFFPDRLTRLFPVFFRYRLAKGKQRICLRHRKMLFTSLKSIKRIQRIAIVVCCVGDASCEHEHVTTVYDMIHARCRLRSHRKWTQCVIESRLLFWAIYGKYVSLPLKRKYLARQVMQV